MRGLKRKFESIWDNPEQLRKSINQIQSRINEIEGRKDAETKLVEVLWNDSEDVERKANSFLGRVRQIHRCNRPPKKTRREIFNEQWNSIENILNKPIPLEKEFDVERKYCVYAHCDPDKQIRVGKKTRAPVVFAASIGMQSHPFYIGKGTSDRPYNLDRNETHRKERQRIKRLGKEIEVSILDACLTEEEALIYESKLIDIFGIKSFGGMLVNIDEGIDREFRREIYKQDFSNLHEFYRGSSHQQKP